MRRILLAIAFLSASTAIAAAAEQITVRANRTSFVDSFVLYSRVTCSGGTIPDLRAGRKPKHGKLTFKRVSGKLGHGPCTGHHMTGSAAYYTPDKGFKGEDSFSISYTHDLYEGAARIGSTSYSYRVTVK